MNKPLCAKGAAARHLTAEPQSTGDDAFLGFLANGASFAIVPCGVYRCP